MRLLSCIAAAVAVVSGSEVDYASQTLDEHIAAWKATMVAENAADTKVQAGEAFVPPDEASEWYMVTIADVNVGYMHTTVNTTAELSTTMEVMDVQVSRGADTSRMAFETVFKETTLTDPARVPVDPLYLSDEAALLGGVTEMSYDQRFADSVVSMNATTGEKGITLVSHNGEKPHTTEVGMPEQPWYGRMRARLEFTRRCREGATHIVAQTMRPELGPRVINLSSTFTGLGMVYDGSEMVEASLWTVRIHDVPVNMSEAYPTRGPLRCYRMLQMGLDMPFGYLLATLGEQASAMQAAEHDPNRKLPELVYTMFVPLYYPNGRAAVIPSVNEAQLVRLLVKVKGEKGPEKLSLPTAGYQRVQAVKSNTAHLKVTVDLKGARRATPEELAEPEYSAPSAMVDSSDEVVIDLAHQIDPALRKAGYTVPPKGSKLPPDVQLEAAFALRDLVQGHISSKHLSTAYASASETARTGSGDCTEHAVLLAAVLKARGIPARVCHGLVYVEQGGSAINGEVEVDGYGNAENTLAGQFGWHMWSQALVNGKWYDFDATLHVPYSVGHVLVGTSSMSDKEAHNNHMQMAALIGNLEMTLLESR